MAASVRHDRLRWIAMIQFAVGVFVIIAVIPWSTSGFHCELEDAVILIIGGLYGLCAIGVGLGVWFAEEWARWIGGFGGLVSVALFTWSSLAPDAATAAPVGPVPHARYTTWIDL